MRRLLFTVVAGVGLVLATGFGYLWWRSYRTSDVWQHTTAQGRSRMLVSYAGGVHFAQVERGQLVMAVFGIPPLPGSQWTHHPLSGSEKWGDRYSSLSQQINWSAGGFAVVSGHTTSTPPAILLTLNVNGTTAPSSNVQMGFTSLNTFTATGGTLTVVDSNGSNPVSADSITFGGGAAAANGATSSAAGNAANTGVSGMGGGSVVVNGGTLNLNSWNMPVNENHLAVVVPYWFPTSLCALIPLIWLARSRRHWRDRRRARHGLCRGCGYDLRASTDRCPECGEAIETAASKLVFRETTQPSL
jgi:hypothetical protein